MSCFFRISICLLLIGSFTGLLAQQRALIDRPLTVAVLEPISSLDSLTSQGFQPWSESIRPLIFNSLTRKAPDLSYEGELAEKIVSTDGGKLISFVIRKGIKFHNGDNLTSADVKYSFDKLFEKRGYKSHAFFELVGSQRFPVIAKIITEGPHTVTFHLSRSGWQELFLANVADIPIFPWIHSGAEKLRRWGQEPFPRRQFRR